MALKTGLKGFSEKLTPQKLLFPECFLPVGNLGRRQVEVGERHRRRFPENIEHGSLPGLAQFRFPLRQRQDTGNAVEQGAAFFQTVQRARFYQAFHDAPVDRL